MLWLRIQEFKLFNKLAVTIRTYIMITLPQILIDEEINTSSIVSQWSTTDKWLNYPYTYFNRYKAMDRHGGPLDKGLWRERNNFYCRRL